MKKIEKKFIFGETIFIFLIIAFVSILFFFNVPRATYPLDGMTVKELDFNFKTENAETIILSRNLDFREPILLGGEEHIKLDPGFYFWKVKNGFLESEVKNFTVLSHVIMDLEYNEIENYSELLNNGDVDLNVTKTNSTKQISFILDVDSNTQIDKDVAVYEGEQNE